MTSNLSSAFHLRARAKLPAPEQCLAHLADHLREHDGELEEQAGVTLVSLPDVRGRLWCADGQLHVDAESSDAETAYFVRNWLEDVFRHLADDQPVQIDWEENWSLGHLPPSFSILKVEELHRPIPQMVRVTLKCPDAARFDRADALHLQVLVNFSVLAAAREAKVPPTWRRYTVRSVDRLRNTIDIDVFLHGKAGPGAAWVSNLQVGQVVGVAGPSGGGIGAAERFVIAGDETALPAIARMMELLPRHCHGEVLIETEGDGAELLLLDVPPRFRLTWLARHQYPGFALENAVRRALADTSEEQTFVWAACETAAASRIRKHVRAIAQRANLAHLVAGYWKK